MQRVNFDGTGQQSLGASGGSVPTDIALDVAGDKMYWSSNAAASIKRSALDGSGSTSLVSQGLLDSLVGVDPLVRADDVSGIALDLTGGRLYWANGRHLNSMPLSGVATAADAVHQFELSGLGVITKIKLDLDNSLVYWTNNTGSVVQRAGLTGAGQTTLVSRGFGRPAGLAIDVSGDKLYFGDTLGTGGRGEILRANLDGSSLSVIYDPVPRCSPRSTWNSAHRWPCQNLASPPSPAWRSLSDWRSAIAAADKCSGPTTIGIRQKGADVYTHPARVSHQLTAGFLPSRVCSPLTAAHLCR